MNEKQLEAVKSLENTLVVAGAGSGKTFTIVNKIKYLLDNNIYKENELLVISFTNESVNDLKRKIDYDLDIMTFHKLAITLINNPDMKISNEYYLKYIINEYFNSYGKYNKKQNKLIKRILQEMDIDNLKKLIFIFINLYKSNYNDINYLLNLYQKSHFINKIYFKIILEIYHIYNQEIESSNLYDFNDMIKIATNNINNNIIKTNYKYIIIDEFQDTSLNRFKLIDAIMKQNNAKIFVVGDDYQSIYRFSGCNLDIFLNFNKLVSNLNIINLDYNYRNPKEIIDVANSFIMKNKNQIKKETICLKNINKPIKICFYKNKRTAIEKILKYIDTKYLILGRNNTDKDIFNVQDKPFLTIHKSKGLEEDNIILINLTNNNNSLPSKIKNHKIINKLIKTDYYPYEEERRLFYVALTRTRNNIYLLVPKSNYSIFIKELMKNYKNYIEYLNIH
ncbi:MAG: UvrD-helicase domain-containing protein [Tenericutes bacterium]|nr:UvrD-helicase domain-containing protein [Mycoplasmatota bacterium]